MTGEQTLLQAANCHLVGLPFGQSQFPPLGVQVLSGLLPVGWMPSPPGSWHKSSHQCRSCLRPYPAAVCWWKTWATLSFGQGPVSLLVLVELPWPFGTGYPCAASLQFLQTLVGGFTAGWWCSLVVSPPSWVEVVNELSTGVVAVGFDHPMLLVILNTPLTQAHGFWLWLCSQELVGSTGSDVLEDVILPSLKAHHCQKLLHL